jgi:hypothetical protein
VKAVHNRMEGDISDRYRDALRHKLEVYVAYLFQYIEGNSSFTLLTKLHRLERDKVGGLQPVVAQEMNQRAKVLLSELCSLLPSETYTPEGISKGKWLFGLQQTSALDAHLVPFIARMRDVGKEALIPEELGEYADRAMAEKEWQDVMGGRKTMIAG